MRKIAGAVIGVMLLLIAGSGCHPSPVSTTNTTSGLSAYLELGEGWHYSSQCTWGDSFAATTATDRDPSSGIFRTLSVSLFDLQTRQIPATLATYPNEVETGTPAIHANRVVWSFDGDIFLYDLSKSAIQQLTRDDYRQFSPKIYGDTVVWLDDRNAGDGSYPTAMDLYAYNLTIGREKRITSAPTAEGYDEPAISGGTIVWVDVRHADNTVTNHAGNDPYYNNEIYIYDLVTEKEQRLTENNANDHQPAIDGNRVAWLRQTGYQQGNVFSYDLATRRERQVSKSGFAAERPSINDNLIVWTDARKSRGNISNDVVLNGVKGSADIYLYDLARNQEINLTASNSGPGIIWMQPVVSGPNVVYLLNRQTGAITYALRLPESITNQREDAVAAFADPKVEMAVRDTIGKPSGEIHESDLRTLTGLSVANVRYWGVESLSGLEKCVNLRSLKLSIEAPDISPLADLKLLTHLILDDATLEDISPLNKITSLRELEVWNIGTSDFSALSKMTWLTSLSLDSIWDLTDLKFIAGLQNLTSFSTGNNIIITDLSPIAGLKKLKELVLGNLPAADFSKLSACTGLTGLSINGNDLADISWLEKLTRLTSLAANNNKISDIKALARMTGLTSLDLHRNRISDISPLAGLTRLTSLDLEDNAISDISALEKLKSLTELDFSTNEVSDISALAGLSDLKSLSFGHNKVTDISPLKGLVQLELLGFYENEVADISAMSALTSLTGLSMPGNKISELRPLGNLTRLDTLTLTNNEIADISALAGLTGLRTLILNGNDITDISALSSLTSLSMLSLVNNAISDISPLGKLTGLEPLSLDHNLITDIRPLSGLINIHSLSAGYNQITDITPLVENPGLGGGDTILWLETNPLNQESVNALIPRLKARGVAFGIRLGGIPEA